MTPPPDRPPEPPDVRRRLTRAALLRPMALLMALIGAVFFAATLVWWIIPLTLVTYAALVYLATQDPTFRNRVLETGRQNPPVSRQRLIQQPEASPEQRVRRLPHGETRQRAEAALEGYDRVRVPIRESDEATRAALEDVIPELDRAAGRFVTVAEAREATAAEARTFRAQPGKEERASALEERLRATDAGISSVLEEIPALRAKVVRVSIESAGAASALAADLHGSLDALNNRLEALLTSATSPGDETGPR